jgi:hypothetical protein
LNPELRKELSEKAWAAGSEDKMMKVLIEHE